MFDRDWETGWTGPICERRAPNCGSWPSRSICSDLVDEGGDWEGLGWTWAGDGGADEGGALVVLGLEVGVEFTGIDDVDGYWRRAVEAAVRATFDDAEPILGILCCTRTRCECCLGRISSFHDFTQLQRCHSVDEAANCEVYAKPFLREDTCDAAQRAPCPEFPMSLCALHGLPDQDPANGMY